jgi:hypothetical protein
LKHAAVFYRRVVQQGEAESHARWIAEYILSRKLDTISDRDIDRAYPALKRLERRPQRLAAMHELEAEGWVKALGLHRDGKPSKWKVNPRVFDGSFDEIANRERLRRRKVRDVIAANAENRRPDGSGAGEAAPT